MLEKSTIMQYILDFSKYHKSIVLKIDYKDASFLYTGDIEKEAELDMVFKFQKKGNPILKSKFIKIPHHGSKYSNTPKFLKAVSPQVAIISGRKTSWYQMPSKEVLDRLSFLKIKIHRTDIDGCIKILSDGSSDNITAWNETKDNWLISNHIIRW